MKHPDTNSRAFTELRLPLQFRRKALAILSIGALSLLALSAACAPLASPRGWASPIDGDNVLLVSHRDKLFALDPETLVGSRMFPPVPNDDDIKSGALYGEPALGSDRIFIPTHEDELYAIDFEGRLVWAAPFDAGSSLIGGVLFYPDPADDSEAPSGMVYFGADDGSLYALESDAGILQWEFKAGDSIWSTPLIFEDVLYVTSLDRSLYALDAANGELLWSFETGAGIASEPVISESERLVYVGGFDSRLRAIDIDTQQERWSLKANNWFWTKPLLADGVLYAGSVDSKVYALSAATGEQTWNAPFETEGPVRAAPLFVGGILIIVDRTGRVYGIDAETGRAAFNAPLRLDDDVYADPLLRTVETDGEVAETALIVTTGGDLLEVSPATLRVVDAVEVRD